MTLGNNKIFFKGLNELRAIAALAVVFHHLELFKNREGKSSLFDVPFLKTFILNLGHNGVICFFVLSGFLITFLLLTEKQNFSTIQIKEFYIRRILRIWPLYFLIVVLSFFVLPLIGDLPYFANQTHYPNLINNINFYTLIYFLFFLSNFALAFSKPIAGAAQSWSVSVEEQFYIVWPWMVKKTRSPKMFLGLVIALFVLKLLLNHFSQSYFGNSYWLSKALRYFQIEYMCIGAMGAVLLFNGNLDKIKSKINNVFVIVSASLLMLIELFKFNHSLILAVLFIYFIYIITTNNLQNKVLNELGKISYGIYMYHPIVMFIAFSFCSHNFQSTQFFNLFYYLIVVSVTIIISFVSFKYYESFFLKFKDRFSVVHSGE